jgi:hypothetical protein
MASPRSRDLPVAPPLPSPLPHFVAERESETAVGGSTTPVLSPLNGCARRLQENRSVPHPLLITPLSFPIRQSTFPPPSRPSLTWLPPVKMPVPHLRRMATLCQPNALRPSRPTAKSWGESRREGLLNLSALSLKMLNSPHFHAGWRTQLMGTSVKVPCPLRIRPSASFCVFRGQQPFPFGIGFAFTSLDSPRQPRQPASVPIECCCLGHSFVIRASSFVISVAPQFRTPHSAFRTCPHPQGWFYPLHRYKPYKHWSKSM